MSAIAVFNRLRKKIKLFVVHKDESNSNQVRFKILHVQNRRHRLFLTAAIVFSRFGRREFSTARRPTTRQHEALGSLVGSVGGIKPSNGCAAATWFRVKPGRVPGGRTPAYGEVSVHLLVRASARPCTRVRRKLSRIYDCE